MRRSYGSDRLAEGPQGEIYLCCRFEKGWTPRQPKQLTRAEYPGTCIQWDEELFEVIAVDPLPIGYRYTLVPWSHPHAIRRFETYNRNSESRQAADRRDTRVRTGKRRGAVALALLVGHLPGRVQERWQNEYSVAAATLTIISAIPCFVFGVIAVVFVIPTMLGAPLGLSPPLLLIGMYLFVESGLRFAIAFIQGRPAGSLAGAIAYGLWSLLRR